MKKFFTILSIAISSAVFGQIQQNVNKTSGTFSNSISEIDSIRINGSLTELEIIFNNGNIESHAIEDIENVTFSGDLIGLINEINCDSANNSGTLTQGEAADAVSSEISYSDGNGGIHSGQIVNSSGVTGLTATLDPGTFEIGDGTLIYTISGTPESSGTASFELNVGGQICTLMRNVELPEGTTSAIYCDGANNSGTLTQGAEASGVSSEISYSDGNGGTHSGQIVNSSGVTGLTATLNPGTFTIGNGTLIYTISGTPESSGTASFELNIGGQTCTLNRLVNTSDPTYPTGTVHCNPSNPTAIVEVINPTTGRIWMDRNLGASQVATSPTTANAIGDVYQWGRGSDGHQCRTSATTTVRSSTDQPGHDLFIISTIIKDWRIGGNNDLWQGVNGINNPCPSGFRLPTITELNQERFTWSANTYLGAFNSVLKLTIHTFRADNGSFIGSANSGTIWSSTPGNGTTALVLLYNNNVNSTGSGAGDRVDGRTVRCIKD